MDEITREQYRTAYAELLRAANRSAADEAQDEVRGGFLVPPDVQVHLLTGEPYPPFTWRERMEGWYWRVREYAEGIWSAVRAW